MEVALSFKMPVAHRLEAAEARQKAESAAARLGFGKAEIGAIAIIVTEAAKNLAKYATGGELIVQTLASGSRFGMEIIALDRGPGMANPGACLRDGFSTGGSAGTGIGAISRLSTLFDIFSLPEQGSAIMSRFWPKTSRLTPQVQLWEIGALCVPMPGETISGDGYAWKELGDSLCVLVTDGLGHGPFAAQASSDAINAFHTRAGLSPAENIKAIHDVLRGTRGAAVGLAHIDPAGQGVRFAGVGNIAGLVIGASGSRNMVSHNGIVGSEVRKVQEFEYPWYEDATLLMHSDGISSRWSFDPYPGLIKRHPSLVAAVLYRDYGRGTDDSTIVVVRRAKIKSASGQGS